MFKRKALCQCVSALACGLLGAHTWAANVVQNGDFESGKVSPWEFGAWEGSVATVAVNNGRVCVDVTNPGDEAWAVQFRQNNMNYQAGHSYSLSADVWATAAITVKVDGSDETGGYTYHFGEEFSVPATGLNGSGHRISTVYSNTEETDTGKFAFLLGKGYVPAGATVCLDNITLDDPQAVITENPADMPIAEIKVNQHGYLPDFDKKAFYVLTAADTGSSNTARAWTLTQNGSVIASGSTQPTGLDSASGDQVHVIDFSSVTAQGDGFVLSVTPATGGSALQSHGFSISGDLYGDMQYEALAYFYHNRSSTPILSSVVGNEHAREAGHPDVAVETYDCFGTQANPAGCRTADVSGGWYDAGDHGKYVVNGGISVWTMMNQFERSKYRGVNSAEFADGTMILPSAEKNNGIPDILDEAAWEVDWFMRMQVPNGYPNAGMVYHKVHTNGWTAIPTLPSSDNGQRVIQPVSTAATLNAAAVGAQCYRVFKDYNSQKAQQCLSFARSAYSAAKSNPEISAPLNEVQGAGGYGDSNTSDEFYWAATELYLATGESGYLSDMQSSEYHDAIFKGLVDSDWVAPDNSFAWPVTELLGVMSLAVVDGEFNRDASLQATAQKYISDRADVYVNESMSQGYNLPFDGDRAFWGSNSNVVNNMILIGLANDFSCGQDDKYINAMVGGMNYLLGANPMDQSYVTGYGERPLQQPHHRFWAKAASNAYPAPPAGVMSGGPNQGLEDEVAELDLAGCDPLKCFMDDIRSWSTNEITVNWNAPFAWVTAYLHEQSSAQNRSALCGTTGQPNPEPDPEPNPEPNPEPTPDPDPSPEPTGGAMHWFFLLSFGLLALGRKIRR